MMITALLGSETCGAVVFFGETDSFGHCSVSVGVQDRSQSFAQWPTLLVHKEVLKLTPNCAQSLQLQKKLFYCQL